MQSVPVSVSPQEIRFRLPSDLLPTAQGVRTFTSGEERWSGRHGPEADPWTSGQDSLPRACGHQGQKTVPRMEGVCHGEARRS